jgi:hypothetical protein
MQWPVMHVFRKRDGKISHFWATELLTADKKKRATETLMKIGIGNREKGQVAKATAECPLLALLRH